MTKYLLENTTSVGAQRVPSVTINEMEHWYFYAKDRKNITKVIFQIGCEFIAFIIQIFVEPQESQEYYDISINKEPNKYTRKIGSRNNFLLREPYIPILETLN